MQLATTEGYDIAYESHALLGLAILNHRTKRILKDSQWLKDTFKKQSTNVLSLWLRMIFPTEFKPKLGLGCQAEFHIQNEIIPPDLANEIEAAAISHFEKLRDWAFGLFKSKGVNIKVRFPQSLIPFGLTVADFPRPLFRAVAVRPQEVFGKFWMKTLPSHYYIIHKAGGKYLDTLLGLF